MRILKYFAEWPWNAALLNDTTGDKKHLSCVTCSFLLFREYYPQSVWANKDIQKTSHRESFTASKNNSLIGEILNTNGVLQSYFWQSSSVFFLYYILCACVCVSAAVGYSCFVSLVRCTFWQTVTKRRFVLHKIEIRVIEERSVGGFFNWTFGSTLAW